nr:AbrB/MazE/SpoVT family DNA-binding domain-containing protein [Halomarina sp. BND7]
MSRHGQATIPKKFREKLGIEAPGRVRFRENDEGEVTVERVPSASDMRGYAKHRGDATTDEPATALLREKRERDRETREATFESGDSDE